MNKSARGALTSTGNGDVTVHSAAIVVNSNNSQAVVATGNGNITGASIAITGDSPGYISTGNGRFYTTSGNSIQTGQSPTTDPLSSLPAPDPDSLTIQSNSQLKVTGNDSMVIQPGRYIGGISLSGNGSLSLTSGIYYMDGGGLSLTGNGSISGTGVMIYNAAQVEQRQDFDHG